MPEAVLPTVAELARRLDGAVSGPSSILCLCPIHEADGLPHTPSCIVTLARGQMIAHCRSQKCDRKDWPVFRAALAAKADVVLSLVGARRGTGPEGIRFDYYWPDGVYSWSKLKIVTPTGRKSFRSGVWNATQGWVAWAKPVTAAPLYGLRELAQALVAAPEALVLIVEGEKDANTGQRLGLPTTSAADGGSWPALCSDVLERLEVKRVCVIPDNDPSGVQHSIRVADALLDRGISVAWLELPDLGRKGDLTDWVEAGGTREKLDQLLVEAPAYDPARFQWRARLVEAGANSPSAYRGANDAHNISLVLQYHEDFRGTLRFNTFRQRVEITKDLPWRGLGENVSLMGYRAREDSDLTNLGAWLIAEMDFAPFNIDTIDRAMKAEAIKASFDEAVVWLDRVPAWDGVGRINSFLQDYFCCRIDADEPEKSAQYLAMVAYMLFGQVVRRIHAPGCQADHSIMLYGNQGDGKDKALRALFGVYLSESPPSLRIDRAADRARTMAGYLLIHDAEMASFSKATDAERKAALTRSHDKGRAAYARELDDVPRRAPWGFSGNLRGMLGDPTGDRRIWPTEVAREITDAIVATIERDRLQLWAEAKARVNAGEKDWPDTAERKELLLWGQSTFRPDAFGDLEHNLDRYLTAEPLWAKPAPGDSLVKGWAWKDRTDPLTALTVGRFFARVLGQVVGVGGGRHADAKHVTVITVYLRRLGWTVGKVRAADVVADEDERLSHRAWRAPEVPGSRSRGHGVEVPGSKKAPVAAPVEAKNPKEEITDQETPGPNARSTIVKNQVVTDRIQVPGSTQQRLPGLKKSKYRESKENFENNPANGVLLGSTPGPSGDVSVELFSAPAGGSALADLALTVTPCPDGVGAMLATLYHDADALAMDVETTGLDAAKDMIRTVQFCDGNLVTVVVWSRPLPAQQALEPLQAAWQGKRIIAHPARFEGAWLKAAGFGDLVLDDTALLWAAVHGGGNRWKPSGAPFSPISLADLAKATLGIDLDKTEQIGWDAEVLRPEKIRYAAIDAVVTMHIWAVLSGQARARSERSGIDVEEGYDDLRKSNALALQMERAGIAFDVAAHQAWTAETEREAEPIRAKLQALEPLVNNFDSPHQLNLALKRRFEAMEAKAVRQARFKWPRTKKGVDLSFGKEELEAALAGGGLQGELRDLVQALHDLKALTGRLTLFGNGFRQHVGADGRLRGSFFAAGAVTGRYVSQAPNLQNIFKEFRAYLVAPAGRSLVAADYSQLELRVLGSLSQCPGMTAAFARGDDYHDAVARNAGVDRRAAKAINFGIIYGKGADSLARDLDVDVGDAAGYLDRWAKDAPGADAFLQAAPGRYAQDGGIATVRRWIDYVDDAVASSKAGTRPRNYPIQGAAGDVLHRAMALLFERIGTWPGDVLPLLTVHDEIVLEVATEAATEVAKRLTDTLTEAFADVLPGAPALHLVFGGIGNTWLAAKQHGEELEKAAREAAKRPKMNGKEHPEARA